MIAGIRGDTDDTQTDGSVLSKNVSFRVEGECRTRPGMEKAFDYSSLAMYAFVSPISGRFVVTLTSSGTLEAISL